MAPEQQQKKKRRIYPLLTLFLLAPAIGELLSGSSPPSQYFTPIPFVILALLYGAGAILVHELKVRWRKDYRAILLLGAAYGIIEEGLLVKSFFDPNWMDLGILGTFGRFAGINFVWAEMLTIYHMAFSITIPIMLVGLAYPELKDERWTTNRSLSIFAVMLVGITVFGYFFMTPYVPPAPQYLIAVASVALLCYVAYRLPQKRIILKKVSKAKYAYLAGLAFGTMFFIVDFTGPFLLMQPLIVMFAGAALVYLMWLFIRRYDWESPRSAMGRWAMASGVLTFLIVITPLQEMDPSRPDNPAFMSFVGLASAILLLLLLAKVRKDATADTGTLLPPPPPTD